MKVQVLLVSLVCLIWAVGAETTVPHQSTMVEIGTHVSIWQGVLWFLSILKDWLPVLATILGGIWALVEWRSSNREKRAEFLDSLMKRFYEKEIRDFFYRCIDEDEDGWYDRGRLNVEFMKQVDSAFAFFSYLCYLRLQGLIEEAEFENFSYQISRLLKNEQTWHYLLMLIKLEKDKQLRNPFNSLIEYGRRVGIDCELFAQFKNGDLPLDVVEKLEEKFSANSVAVNDLNIEPLKNEKIGHYIRRVVFPLVEQCCVSEDELLRLEQKEASHETFGLSYPFLVRQDKIVPMMREHYYVAIFSPYGDSFQICNEWKQRQYEKVRKWVKDVVEVYKKQCSQSSFKGC